MTLKKKTCQLCEIPRRRLRKVKGKFLCYHCWVKGNHIINGSNIMTLEEVLSKDYRVYTYVSREGRPKCTLCLPAILAGKTIRISLVEESKKKVKQ